MKRTLQFVIVSVVTVSLLLVFYFFFPHVWGEAVYPLDYRDSIKKYSIERNLHPNFVAAVIFTESRFHKDSVSSAGAVGLMQLMPATAGGIAAELGEPMGNLRDPGTNIKYGTYYLRELMDKFDGNTEIVSAAYNAGAGRADQYRTEGVPLPFETQNFIQKIKKAQINYEEVYDSWYIEGKEPVNPVALGFTNVATYVRGLILGR